MVDVALTYVMGYGPLDGLYPYKNILGIDVFLSQYMDRNIYPMMVVCGMSRWEVRGVTAVWNILESCKVIL